MRAPVEYLDAGAAYAGVVAECLAAGERSSPVRAPTSPSSGVPTLDLFAHSFSVLAPRSRLPVSPARPLNVAFPFGAFLLFLAAADDVASMEHYNPAARRFSDNGATLRGAYGPRASENVARAAALLRGDPQTRRAVVTIFSSDRDLGAASRDVPCPVAAHFIARGSALDAIFTFRSQNALMVFPYDICFTTLLHEFVAAQSGLRLGRYVQHTGSMHLYEPELAQARDVASAGAVSLPMPHMEQVGRVQLADALAYERAVRAGADPAPPDLPPFWAGLCRLVAEHAAALRAGRQLRDASAVTSAFA